MIPLILLPSFHPSGPCLNISTRRDYAPSPHDQPHRNAKKQVAAAQNAAHMESLQVMSKRLAELYSEMGLPVGAGGGMPGAK